MTDIPYRTCILYMIVTALLRVGPVKQRTMRRRTFASV